MPIEEADFAQQGFNSPVQRFETSGKPFTIKGRDRELRNLGFEMSFGKAKEAGFLSIHQ